MAQIQITIANDAGSLHSLILSEELTRRLIELHIHPKYENMQMPELISDMLDDVADVWLEKAGDY